MVRASPAVQLDLVDVAHGWTPIMFAASRNWSRVVSWLQRRGANVHRATGSGLTCVWLAATAGSVNVLQLLIQQYKCDLDVDHQDSSPLEALCSYDGGAALLHGPRLECATLLLLGGATVGAGFVSVDCRAIMVAWAFGFLNSHRAPVVLALGVKHGRDAAGDPCVLGEIDGHAVQVIGSFLRRPHREVRRVERAMWVWLAEDHRQASVLRAVKRGEHGRVGHCCSSVF